MAGIAKSAATPAHMTTLPVRSHRPDQASTMGLIKGFTVPSANYLAATQPVQQTSRRSSEAKPPLPRPRAKRGKGETMQGFQARHENCSPALQCIRYLLEIPVCLSTLARDQESLQCPNQPKTWQGHRSPTVHTTRPQTRRAPTKQLAMGIRKIQMNPIKAWSQISTVSWLRDQPSLNCNCSTV